MLQLQLKESNDKNLIELNKKNDDIDFYRKSYEEQKIRINQEHELISASLYELALQFMGLKNELTGKDSPTNSSTRSVFDSGKI